MIVPRTDRTIVIHLTTRPGFHSAYVFGRSRDPRTIVRDRLEVVHVAHRPGDDLAAVLEAVAAALVLPPGDRWQPRP
jgi:hypothetical protein